MFREAGAAAPNAGWLGTAFGVASGADASGEVEPIVYASGLPPGRPDPPFASQTRSDLGWLSKLQMPDIPVRWDERVIRYLEYFRDDPRGHSAFANMLRRSGRWRDMIRRSLRRKSLPGDLMWVSMLESGFEPKAHSSAGAAGLWQFTPDTGRIYGLAIDHWIDQRLDPQQATDAAVELLADLHRRFGGWELALAAYDMGYGGLSAVVRRYNTNDFWSLAHTEGTLPWETTLYVPKIIAAAVAANNLAAFGFADVSFDAPIAADEVDVPPGVPLPVVAQAAGCTLRAIQSLNPELRAGRTPPASDGESATPYRVKVPAGRGVGAAQSLARMHVEQPTTERYVLRFGETLEQVAAAHKTTPQRLAELNGIAPAEVVRGGTVLLVPKVEGGSPTASSPTAAGASGPSAASAAAAKPTVIVPADAFVYPDRRRVFYRVQRGDTLKEIASALHVSPDDLDRWNDLDPSARLQEGMTLQAFVRAAADLSRALVLAESDVVVLPVGSDEFFAALEREKGFRRMTVTAKGGD
jgi:membrane-bound lytic murein transglycosylase D